MEKSVEKTSVVWKKKIFANFELLWRLTAMAWSVRVLGWVRR